MIFTDNERKIAKTYNIIVCISVPILFVLGMIFVKITDFERSLPLGMILLYSSTFLLILTVMLHLLFGSNTNHSETTTTYRVYKGTRASLLIIIVLIYLGSRILVSLSDLALGTKEIVLQDAKIIHKEERISRYTRRNVTYLTGTAKDGTTIKIRIKEKETKGEVATVLKTSNNVNVSYYKNLNLIYEIEAKNKK